MRKVMNGVSGSLFNKKPKLKALEIIKKQNFNYENALTYINEVLHFYRESYRNTGNEHYLNGLKYWNKIKYETQKEGEDYIKFKISKVAKDEVGICTCTEKSRECIFCYQSKYIDLLNKEKDNQK